MFLKRTAWLVLLVVLPATGCARQSDAGAALVATGAVVAVAAAYASADRVQCGGAYNCNWNTWSTSKNAGAAAAGVAAGVGIAALGAAIVEPDPPEVKPRKRNPPPQNPFRLVRPAEDPVTPAN